LLKSEDEQWETVASEIRKVRETFGPKTELGKRRTTFGEAKDVDLELAEVLVEREPVTIVVSERGWVRALRGHVTDLSSVTFKSDDALQFHFHAETTSKCVFFASNGKFYTIEAAKLPGGRGHGEPVRLFIDLEQDASIVAAFKHQGGRKFLLGSAEGKGFVVPEDECLANTRKGKQVLNVKAPDKAVAITLVEGDLVAAIGENRKMIVFPINQVPEMTRGAGVRLQRYKDGILSDIMTFPSKGDGMTWFDSAGRTQITPLKELAAWRGNRGDAGRVKPDRFPKNNKFGKGIG
jgi:topoisomerase-4 subunit A